MIDIHHHLLYGTDDGSPSLENSVAMVKMAVEDGITHIVATPHSNHAFPYDPIRNQERLNQIRAALPASLADRIQLGLGCDFHLDWENTQGARTNPRKYTINAHSYLLVELPDAGIPSRIHDVLYQMRLDGLIPVLTHPERNATLQRSRALLRDWMRADILVQITAGSLTGAFGKVAQRVALELLEQQWVHFVASDAHNLTTRPPRLSEAYALVAKRSGEATAQRLFVSNPLAAFRGDVLGPQPAPAGLYEDEVYPPWWKRLFRNS